MPLPGLLPPMATVLAPPPVATARPLTALTFRTGRKGRDFPVALGLSVVLHVAVFATIFSLPVRPVLPGVPFTIFRIDEPAPGNEAAMSPPGSEQAAPAPVPVPEPLPGSVEQLAVPIPIPRELPAPIVSVPGEGAGAGAGAPAGAAGAGGRGGAGLSAAERLSRGYGDPRLLMPVDRLPPEEVTEAEWLRLRLANRLEIYNDSIAAEAEAKLRATDWTVKDKNGGRWGVSPGQIHLGNRTLPLPFGFSPSPGRRDEMAGRVRSWNESQAQAARVEAAQTFEQRVKAIRARQEAARDSARKAGGGR